MKIITLLLLAFFTILHSFAQDITGHWHGTLKFQGMQFRLVFNISKTGNGYTATMDSPDQGAKDLPLSSITYEASVLKLALSDAGIEYEGTLNKEHIIVGTFKQ